jgi:hypothetical protein
VQAPDETVEKGREGLGGTWKILEAAAVMLTSMKAQPGLSPIHALLQLLCSAVTASRATKTNSVAFSPQANYTD